MMQLVETVASNAKFHLSQDRTSQSTATNAFKVIKEIKDNYHNWHNVILANWICFIHYTSMILVSSMALKTLVTIDWLVVCWLEWNLALLATVSTSCIVHFSVSSI